MNAEGLPIIDINEPVSTTEEVTFRPTGTFDDPDVLPLWTLSEQEKTRRKAERERILDILEEEERVEQERDRVASRERLQAELEKRKEAAKTEMENLKRARELQKKMGRALIRNVIETRDRDEQDRTQQALEDKEKEEAKKALKPKKSVSFADVDDESDSETPVQRKGKAVDWGDVSPARLRSQLKSPVLPKTQTQKQPMKMEVVERIPGGQQPHTPTNAHIADSDDESEPDSQSVENDGRQKQEDASNSSATGFEASDGGDPEWDEDDLDYAHHQREIALAYFEKRAAIGAQVSSAINAHTHKVSESEWDQPVSCLLSFE